MTALLEAFDAADAGDAKGVEFVRSGFGVLQDTDEIVVDVHSVSEDTVGAEEEAGDQVVAVGVADADELLLADGDLEGFDDVEEENLFAMGEVLAGVVFEQGLYVGADVSVVFFCVIFRLAAYAQVFEVLVIDADFLRGAGVGAVGVHLFAQTLRVGKGQTVDDLFLRFREGACPLVSMDSRRSFSRLTARRIDAVDASL